MGRSRRYPILSEILFSPVFAFAAFLHGITKPLGIEPIVSMLITGGLFGLALIPLGCGAAILQLLELTNLWPDATPVVLRYIVLPFSILYIVQILILDKTHLRPDLAHPHQPRNLIEQGSENFFRAGLDYFPIQCIPWSDDTKLPPTEQYIFAVHPHGIHCFPLALLSTRGSDFDTQFPGLVANSLVGLAATVMFKLPLVRELFILMGYVDASRPIAQKALEGGKSIYVCTGGEEESMLTDAGEDFVVLEKRKGFVRLALSYGASLVPVFGVGNSDIYTTYTFMIKQRQWLQKTCGIAIPIFHGRWFTTLPYKKPIRVLIGEPIKTPKPKVVGEKPDSALVDKYHAKYIAALTELHAKHVKDRTLQIR